MKTRRHHNNKGTTQMKNGKGVRDAKRIMAKIKKHKGKNSGNNRFYKKNEVVEIITELKKQLENYESILQLF